VVFLYLAPFVVALGMPFIARVERLSAWQLGGLLIAFAGDAWAFAEGFTRPASGPHQLLGDALGVLAGVLWGATTLAIRGSRLSSASPEKTLLYQLAISGVLLTATALASGAPWPASLSTLAWSSMAFQIVAVTFVSFLVWFWLIRHYPATRLSSFTLLTASLARTPSGAGSARCGPRRALASAPVPKRRTRRFPQSRPLDSFDRALHIIRMTGQLKRAALRRTVSCEAPA